MYDKLNILGTPTDFKILHTLHNEETGTIESHLEITTAKPETKPSYTPPQRRTMNEERILDQLKTYVDHLKGVDRDIIDNLSHRVKTPLTAILSALQLMNNYSYEGAPQFSHLLDCLMHSSVELTKFINDATDYYYISKDMISIERDVACLNDIIEAILSVYQSQMMAEMITFSHTQMDTNGTPFFTDKKRLIEIVNHCISNAIKAFGPYAPAKRIHMDLGLDEALGRLRIVISDTGSGVNLATAEQLFRPLLPTNEMGLGLTLCRMLLAKMGNGTIRFISPMHPYKTALEIAVDVDVVEHGLPPLSPIQYDPPTLQPAIVMIDDNETNLGMLAQIVDNVLTAKLELDKSAIPILLFINARAALETLTAHGLDCGIIFLDIKMPEMSGIEFIRQYSGYYGSTSTTKIVVLSGLPKQSIEYDLREAGLDHLDYVSVYSKPYNLNELEGHLRRVYKPESVMGLDKHENVKRKQSWV